ncbi:uncharacterized protein LOC132303890 [Cornus florida]|uniref:uncharacterized protein LOC132303890 n=1 Tax=Cornus florida TaxID=4283 RepID=UPI0028990733|nr:uncharacterized protein LOC132303890 [Cornus florida]
MDERQVACFCRFDGKIEKNGNEEIIYIGGVMDPFMMTTTTTYDSFINELRECSCSNISGKVIYYTTEYNKNELVRMTGKSGFRMMLLMSGSMLNVYVGDTTPVTASCTIPSDHSEREFVEATDCNLSTSCLASTSSLPPTNAHQDSFRHIDGINSEGQLFKSPNDFKDALVLFGLRNHFWFKYLDNSRRYYRVVCDVKSCPWKLSAGCKGSSDLVRIMRFNNVHIHTAQDISDYKAVFRSNEMGRAIVNKVRDNSKYTPKAISTNIESEFSVNMTYMQSWRAKECARHIIEGNPEDSYILVLWLCERIKNSIPDTITSWECTEDKRFKRVFVAYGCSIQGFINYCRPILAIDACHLSGNYQGTMLGATGYDANEGLWPLAYAIVSTENDDDWHWFLNKVKEILNGRIVTILTDRHPSLISCIRDIFGSQYHSWCLRHLMANFSTSILGNRILGLRSKGKESAKKLLDQIAYARTLDEYEHALAAMRLFRELCDWVLEQSPEHWSNAKFTSKQWDKLYTNQVESFNAWVKEERVFSITRLMDAHVQRLSTFLYQKSLDVQKWTIPVGKRIEKKIREEQKAALGFSLIRLSNTECTAYDRLRRPFKVIFGTEQFCSCLKWTMTGIPCSHACYAIHNFSLNIYDMVEPWFKVETQQKLCKHLMSSIPMHDMPIPTAVADDESASHLRPPAVKRPPGRPRIKRIESQFQDVRPLHCSRCGETGHNRRNCKAPIPG